ncbi:Caspase-6 protein [Melia azedarach]|uniref:Caspase-6 protein n=1 Tax=Melia azedarach TaxID=155640 RepID=A0ACC1XYI1_MELAZ|nr:Caspase-6 protein [Melia azedarach]
MAWRSAGSLSRSLSRVSSLRSPPPIPRVRTPQQAPRLQSRRFSFGAPRNLGELGCTASFLPLHSVAAVARFPSLSVNARAFSELSHVT